MFAVLLEEASEPNRNRIAIETRRNPLGRGSAALARRSELRTGKIVANRKVRGKRVGEILPSSCKYSSYCVSDGISCNGPRLSNAGRARQGVRTRFVAPSNLEWAKITVGTKNSAIR